MAILEKCFEYSPCLGVRGFCFAPELAVVHELSGVVDDGVANVNETHVIHCYACRCGDGASIFDLLDEFFKRSGWHSPYGFHASFVHNVIGIVEGAVDGG